MGYYLVDLVIMMLQILFEVIKKLRNSRCKPKTLTTRKFNKFDTDAFLKDLEKVPLDEIKHHLTDPNEMWMIWKTFFTDLLDKHAPMSNIQIRGDTLPYITSAIENKLNNVII